MTPGITPGIAPGSSTPPSDVLDLERRIVRSALRYAAVADWFENRPMVGTDAQEAQAFELFNTAESELRQVAALVLRRTGMRERVLQAAGVE